MPKVLWWTESVSRVFPYLQIESSSSGHQWTAFLPPQRITLPLSDPSDFGLSWNACELFMILLHTQVMPQMLWWTESVGRVFSYPQQDSTSSGHQWSAILPPQQITLPPISHLRLLLELKCLPIPLWFYSTPRLCQRCCNGLRVLIRCYHTYNNITTALCNNVFLPISHLPPISPLRLWL